MQKDKRKWTAEYIEGNVGKLTAQIVLNNLIDNGYKMWFIGNTDGNCLYTVELSNNERVVVGFTSQEIASVYVNKPEVKKKTSTVYYRTMTSVMNTLVTNFLDDSTSLF